MKEKDLNDLKKVAQKQFDVKYGNYLQRISIKAWLEFAKYEKREKRLAAYSKNYMYRRRIRNLFCSWRGVSHQWFKERINKESAQFRQMQRNTYLERKFTPPHPCQNTKRKWRHWKSTWRSCKRKSE